MDQRKRTMDTSPQETEEKHRHSRSRVRSPELEPDDPTDYHSLVSNSNELLALVRISDEQQRNDEVRRILATHKGLHSRVSSSLETILNIRAEKAQLESKLKALDEKERKENTLLQENQKLATQTQLLLHHARSLVDKKKFPLASSDSHSLQDRFHIFGLEHITEMLGGIEASGAKPGLRPFLNHLLGDGGCCFNQNVQNTILRKIEDDSTGIALDIYVYLGVIVRDHESHRGFRMNHDMGHGHFVRKDILIHRIAALLCLNDDLSVYEDIAKEWKKTSTPGNRFIPKENMFCSLVSLDGDTLQERFGMNDVEAISDKLGGKEENRKKGTMGVLPFLRKLLGGKAHMNNLTKERILQKIHDDSTGTVRDIYVYLGVIVTDPNFPHGFRIKHDIGYGHFVQKEILIHRIATLLWIDVDLSVHEDAANWYKNRFGKKALPSTEKPKVLANGNDTDLRAVETPLRNGSSAGRTHTVGPVESAQTKITPLKTAWNNSEMTASGEFTIQRGDTDDAALIPSALGARARCYFRYEDSILKICPSQEAVCIQDVLEMEFPETCSPLVLDLSGCVWESQVLRQVPFQVMETVKCLKASGVVVTSNVDKGLNTLKVLFALVSVFAPNVTDVDLQRNAFGIQCAPVLEVILQQQSLLTHLNLYSTHLSPKLAKIIKKSLHPKQLQFLNLSSNSALGPDGARCIGSLLPHCEELVHFSYAYTDPGVIGTSHILTGLLQLRNLEHLDFESSILETTLESKDFSLEEETSDFEDHSGVEKDEILGAIRGVEKDEILGASRDPTNARLLSACLEHSSKLLHLNICNTGIGDEAISIILGAIQMAKAPLQYLNLEHNFFLLSGATAIESYLTDSPGTLCTLKLGHSLYDGQKAVKSVLMGLSRMPNSLQHLSLENCFIEDYRCFSPFMTVLETLNVKQNDPGKVGFEGLLLTEDRSTTIVLDSTMSATLSQGTIAEVSNLSVDG